MNVGELKLLIADLSDDIIVVRHGHDHNFKEIRTPIKSTALVSFEDSKYIYEDYGDEFKDNKKDKRINVLIVC